MCYNNNLQGEIFPMSKKDIVKEQILRLISQTAQENSRLPGERELAVMLHAGRNTVRAALFDLEKEGRVERRRKTGTVVKYVEETPYTDLAGLVIRTSGHLYSEIYHAIVSEFNRNNYRIQTVSTDNVISRINMPFVRITGSVKKMLDAKPSVIVLSGVATGRIPYHKEICKQHPILLNFYDSSAMRDFSGVWIDYRQAGYLAGKYLVDKGCKHPLFFSNYIPHGARFNTEAYKHHKDKLLIDGFRQALIEGNIDPEPAVISSQSVTCEQHLSLLNNIASYAKYLPDGFCGAADNIVIHFMQHLMEIHHKIPEDITFVGIGNTPWSNNPSIVPFSSVDLNCKGVAEAIVQQAQLPFEERKDIFVMPELVIR